MNRTLYRALWVFDILAIVGMVLVMALPIQDYALREFTAWREHPSPETYQVFLEKQREERALHFIIAVPFAVTALLLSVPLRKYRKTLR